MPPKTTPASAAAPAASAELHWSDHGELPITLGDVLHWRTLNDRCYITVGQLNLPLGVTPIPEGGAIDVRPVARFVLTPASVQIWAKLLAEAASQFSKAEGGPEK